MHFSMEKPLKEFFTFRGTPNYEKGNNTKWQCAVYGDYSSIANCGVKFPAIFLGIFEVFTVFKKNYLFITRLLAKPWL
jgi:hypothetical protein